MKRKKIAALLLAAVLTATAALTGCSAGNESQDNQGADDLLVNDSWTAHGLGIRHAQNFDITYLADSVKLVTDSAGRELLLVPEGAQAPAGYEDAIQISTPIRRAMFTSAAYIGFLEMLEEESVYDSIAALTIEPSQWTVQPVLDRFAGGQIMYIAPETWIAGDIENLAAAAPELVFTDMSSGAGAALCAALKQLGINYVVLAEDRDSTASAYLEWMKFFGAFYNLDEEARDLYQAKAERLEEIYSKSAVISEGQRPVVAFGRADGGIVYTQGGESAAARQLEQAGAVYALKDMEGSGEVELGIEEFLDRCKDADILIYNDIPANMPRSLLDVDPLFAEFKAYQNQRIYTLDHSYYMNRARVVEKLEDLMAICHPELETDHVFSMYQPLQNY